MAPSHSRQLIAFTLPTIVALIGYFWYRKKRLGTIVKAASTSREEEYSMINNRSIDDDCVDGKKQEQLNGKRTENVDINDKKLSKRPKYSRSLSGVDTAPIDIVVPKELRSYRSNPISDEDLDYEIEKVRPIRYGTNSNNSSESKKKIKTPSPKTPNHKHIMASVVQNTPPSPQVRTFTPKTRLDVSLTNSPPSPVYFETITSVKANTPSPSAESKKCSGRMSRLDKEMANLKLEENAVENVAKTDGDEEEEEDVAGLQRQNSERDSANHSPVDVMLASPSLSSISDNHSEGSSDSGKGGSDVATPPPPPTSSRLPTLPCNITNVQSSFTIYEFVIPQTLVGKLIGRHGSSVSQIKTKTNAHIVVKKHPTNNKMKICMIEGKQDEIDDALKLIREKFPIKRFPDVTLEQICYVEQVPTIPLIPDHLYLKLIEGINNDTVLSCMVTPSHLFLQQPTHPSFVNLNLLKNFMYTCYAESESPMLPSTIPENTVCAAYSVDSWYRAIVLSTEMETDVSYVKFLDYGGYAYVDNANLRQIRTDFMLLPFQAAECYLANVKPVGDEEAVWCSDAYKLMAEITKGTIIYTQIVDYAEDGVPLVHCYMTSGEKLLFLNEELVRRGYAEWTYMQDDKEGAVGGIVNQ